MITHLFFLEKREKEDYNNFYILISIFLTWRFPLQSLQIPDVKDFMAKLLAAEHFDAFLLSEASITTFTTFYIDGSFHADYFGNLEAESEHPSAAFPCWKMLRPFFFDLVKGKNTPLNFKIIFRLADYNVEKLLSQSGIALHVQDISGLFLNVHYNGKEVFCTTGTSLRIFTLDKSLDHAWDSMVQKFFRQKQIPFLSVP